MDNGHKRYKYSLLVTRKSKFSVPQWGELKEMCKNLSLNPLDRYDYSLEKDEELVAILYPNFETLDKACGKKISDSDFVEIMRGIVSDFNQLKSRGFQPWKIDGNTLVVEKKGEKKIGGVLNISNHTYNSNGGKIDFQASIDVVKYLCSKTRQKWLRSSSLTILFDCMLLANCIKSHQRLLASSPYFLDVAMDLPNHSPDSRSRTLFRN